MAARARNAGCVGLGAVRAVALALLALPAACYPNPDDLRSTRTTSSNGGASGSLGGSNGMGGKSPGSGGNSPGTGGAPGAGGGGGTGNALCGKPACGGASVVGDWAFVSTCASVSSSALDNCAGGTIDRSGVHRSGSITLNADTTFSTSETDTGTFIFDVPTSCLGGGTCAMLQTAFQGPGYVGQPNPIFSSATCSTTATGCRCLLGALGMATNATGTYSVSGTSLTLVYSTGDVADDTFCVSGSDLHLIYSDSTASAPDEAVFTKQ